MKTKEVIELLKQGKQPMVRLTGNLWEDSWGNKGMLARITEYHEQTHDDMVKVFFDYSENKAHNLALQEHNYYIGNDHTKTGTAFEAGMMDEKDMTEDVYMDLEDEQPVEIINNPLLETYIMRKSPLSYVEWLESELCKTWELK